MPTWPMSGCMAIRKAAETAFSVSINLATKLQNMGKDVSFKLPWNRPHSGDYALNELFAWLAEIL